MSIAQGPWGQKPAGRAEPFETFTPADWEGEPPPHDWIVDGCFLRGTVAMLSGDGGLGKSLLMQQLCTAAALGKAWLGLGTERCNSFAFFCEDDKDELWRRQDSINRFYGCSSADLTPIRFAERAGRENVLMEFDRRTDRPQPTPLFDQLRHAVREHEAKIIVLDTLADTFAGNEIIRNQVRRFISALRQVAIETQGVVILTAHPSNVGITSGSGISGSTAWNNSVRCRLYLTRSRTADDGEEVDPNERLLKTMKHNQGPFGGKLGLRWEEGVFVRSDQRAPGLLDRLEVDGAVMRGVEKLCRLGTRMSPDRFARTYVVTALMTHPDCRGFSRGEIEGAKDRLLGNGRLVNVTIRRDRKDRVYIRPADIRFPEEEGKPE